MVLIIAIAAFLVVLGSLLSLVSYVERNAELKRLDHLEGVVLRNDRIH